MDRPDSGICFRRISIKDRYSQMAGRTVFQRNKRDADTGIRYIRLIRIKEWVHRAFRRRKKQPDPDISPHPFGRNRSDRCADGWRD